MTLDIVTSEDIIFEGEVSSVTLPGSKGQFTVLNHHASLVSTLEHGFVRYTDMSGKKHRFDIGGGVVVVDNNVVSVCVF